MGCPSRMLRRRLLLGGAFWALTGPVPAVSEAGGLTRARTCIVTLPIPPDWGGVTGYPLQGDPERLPEGQLRLHLVQGVAQLGAQGEGLSDDRSGVLGRQARAMRALRDLPLPQGELRDVTAAAARRGITPGQFRGPQRGGKYRQPNAILMMSQPEGKVWFTTTIPIDRPGGALIGTLHVLWPQQDASESYAQIILGNVPRERLKQIVLRALLLVRMSVRTCA